MDKRELFLVEYGTLIDKEECEYYVVYDKKYGYYDENQYFTYNLKEAIDACKDYVSCFPNTYGIIVNQGLQKLSDEDIENGNYNICDIANYNVENIVYSIMSDKERNTLDNFVVGQKVRV